MPELLSSTSLFAVVLTLSAYELGCACQRRTGLAICNPILLGAVGVVAVLVAAIDGVGLGGGVRQALHPLVGVYHNPVSAALQGKTGVAQPCNDHCIILLSSLDGLIPLVYHTEAGGSQALLLSPPS